MGAGGSDPTPENHKNIGFLCHPGPDRLKNNNATKPAFNVGPLSARQRNATKWPIYSGLWILYPPSTEKKTNNKNPIKFGTPLTKLSGSAQGFH